MKAKQLVVLACALLLLAAPGCSMARNMNRVKAVAADYYEAIKEKDYDKAFSYYAESFFEKTDKDQWQESLTATVDKLGNLEKYQFVTYSFSYKSGKGTTYTLTYRVTYSGASSTEIITLFCQDAKSPIQIVGHSIKADDGETELAGSPDMYPIIKIIPK